MREHHSIRLSGQIRLVIVSSWLLAANLFAFEAGAGTTVQAWGGGTFVDTSSYYNWGQSIVPAGLTNAAMVAGGWRHSLALDGDGTLTPWGSDASGQTDFDPGSDYIAISCGWQHSLALQSDGSVAAAGDDTYHQTEVPSDLSNVVAVACGFYHSLALKTDGTVVAWGPTTNNSIIGTNDYGQILVPTNLSNVVAIAGGGWHSLALLSDGTVRGWGRDDSGQADIPPGLSNVVAIKAGAVYDLALLANGTVFAWGDNSLSGNKCSPRIDERGGHRGRRMA